MTLAMREETNMEAKLMTQEEIKRRVLERINSPVEWPDNGTARLGLMQVAHDQGWYLQELN